ncbi:MAG: hypothetical protein J7507_03905 [Pseudoxanthomonas sp.]|nr:hypothetical protein [Pseudoxanthomonas sp.]
MRAGLVACLLATGAAITAGASTGDDMPVPFEAAADGIDQASLTATWWQWALSLPLEPYMDRDGHLCALGQEGPVWFLAGTDGTFNATRQCQVPPGTYLFLPVVNRYAATELSAKKESTQPTCEELQKLIAMSADGLVRSRVTLDGKQIKNIAAYRVQSPGCFDPYPGLPRMEGKYPPLAASDGYWLLIPPLPAGQHVLDVDAHYRAAGGKGFETVQRFGYTLQVGAAPQYVAR